MERSSFVGGQLVPLVVCLSICSALRTEALAGGPSDDAARARAIQLFSAAPAAFIENTGQIDDPSIRYVFNGSGANVYHTTSGPVFQVFQRADVGADGVRPPTSADDRSHDMFTRADTVRPYTPAASRTFLATFPGARVVNPIGHEMLDTKINYCLGADQGKWRSGVPTFGVVVYEGLYDGIDLHTYGRRSNLKYEFHVAPGADWRKIGIRYDGIAGLSIAENGSLIVDVGYGWGSLRDDAPIIYQEIGGRRVSLPGRFVIVDNKTYSFEITGTVDPAASLVIDPELAWSTYLGGSGNDWGYGVAVDASGNVLVAGQTLSSGWASGGYDTSLGGASDAFVAKLTPSGTHLWSTYLGGSTGDRAWGVAVDPSGNVAVTGETGSSDWVSGGFDTTYNGGNADVFVAKLSPSGAHVWSTCIGASDDDVGRSVATDASGNVLVTGNTFTSRMVSWGSDDIFVTKLSPLGAHLWTVYLGGENHDYGYGVAVDASGNVLVTGATGSSGWVSGGFDTSFNDGGDSGGDAFVVKLNPSGAHLWSTYLGGSTSDEGYAVAVDSSGNVAVTGFTESSGWVSGGFDTCYNGGDPIRGGDAFVAKLSPSGAHIWSTYLGAGHQDQGNAVAMDASGNVVVAGSTSSSGWISGGPDTTYNGGTDQRGDAFVAKLTSSGAHLWSTYLGGSLDDLGRGVAVDRSGNALAIGYTYSSGWVSGGFDTSYNGGYQDAFVAKIGPDHTLTINSAPIVSIAITGNNSGMTNYTSGCEHQRLVNLTAPATATVSGKRYNFIGWTLDGQPAPAGTTLNVTMNANHTAIAVYNLFGDVNNDCKVNILDLVLMRNHLGQSTSTGDNWRFDANHDGKINVLDLIHVRSQLNTNCP